MRYEAEAEVRSCPQLSVLGLDALAGTVVEPTDVGGQAPTEVTVVLRPQAVTLPNPVRFGSS